MFLQLAEAMPVSTELPGLITTSAMSVAIIQAMKNSDLPIFKFINQHSSNVNRFVGLLFAFGSSLGLHYKYDETTGAFAITGVLTAAAITQGLAHMGFDTAKSWSFNWILYQAIKGRAADVAAAAEARTSEKPVVVATPGVAAAAAETKAESGIKKTD